MELEVQHLAPYLPFGLKLKYSIVKPDGKIVLEYTGIMKSISHNEDETHPTRIQVNHEEFEHIWMFKPIIRPMSDIIKEIEIDGEKFVPLLVLAGMAGICSASDFIIDGYQARHKTCTESTFELGISNDFIWKESSKWKDFGAVPQQLRMFNKLFEWHFDVFNLIKNNLAIDINKI